MKVLQSSPAYEAARAAERVNKGEKYDNTEEKLLVRFEKGVDFNTLDEFRSEFLSVINEEGQAHMRKQLDLMARQGALEAIDRSSGGGMDIGIPVAMVDMEALNAKVG
ncbi:MAG: hypothetical protein OXH09_21160 [Gammaproteobacteria bacterium]|nr:hypothetical protein [Gammaproteobacteria bacterium]